MGAAASDATIIINVNPYVFILRTAIDILELTGIIPDPFELLMSLFVGRPREQATILQAQRLCSARNPAARLLGIQLERMVRQWDIVTSTGGSGRTILDAAASQFTANLVAQGVPLARAQTILTNAFSRAAQEGLAIEPELRLPLPDQLAFNGPAAYQNMFDAQYAKLIAKGINLGNALIQAEKYTWKNLGLRYLFKLTVGQPQNQDPPPARVPPFQDGTCPSGYTLDPLTQFCLFDSQGGQGGGGGGGGGQGGDGQNDELGDYGDQILTALDNITNLLSGQGGQGGGGQGEDCCGPLVDSIGTVAAPLQAIANILQSGAGGGGGGGGVGGSGGSGGGVDLAPIVDALNNITAALKAVSGAGTDTDQPVDLSTIDADLKAIRDAITGAGPIGPIPANPTPPQPTPFVQPAPYTVAQALADVEATITQMPNAILAPQT